MSASKKKKALIVYASITGNTEKVAMRFKEVFDRKGPWGDWQCDVFKVTKKTYQEKAPYRIEDYDFLALGAPIWAGIPPLYLFDDHKGALTPIMMPQMKPGEPPPMMPGPGEGWGPKKGLAFITYGGQGQGPIEANAALTCLEIRLDAARIKCVGKFACCGKQWTEPTVDPIAAKFDWMVGDATIAISRYKENPHDPEFAKLTPAERQMFERAVSMTGEFSTGAMMKSRAWHWDFKNRPNERDLLKADIFLSEILEDYYGGGVEMYPFSQYVCIA
jgi:hypothetical protein